MSHWVEVGGWTLIHFAWQGALLALAAAGILRLCRPQSANTRYIISCVALVAMLASPAITARVLWSPMSDVTQTVTLHQTVSSPQVMSPALGRGMTDDTSLLGSLWTRVNAVLPIVVFGWLAVVMALLVRMAGGLWRVRHLHVRSLSMALSGWQATGDRIASRLHVNRVIHIVESALVETPTAIGWLKPVILLPIAALANLSPSQVEAILAHELAHIRRHDYIVNIAQTLAETLLFYHPGVWWVSKQIRTEREHCCDDVTMAVCGDPVDYATALAELEAYRSRRTSLALAVTDGSLTDRVRRILRVPVRDEPRSVSWVVTLGLTIVLASGMGSMYVPWLGQSHGASGVLAGAVQDAEPIASPDTLDWQVYPIAHFDIHYYPALDTELEQVADMAERAYQTISEKLAYELPLRVPLILFKTRSDFEQHTIVSEIPSVQSISSFAEPGRDRVVILLDDPPDQWLRRITHEVTHIFAFDIIPRHSFKASVPVWIDEGLADYMTGVWRELDVAQLRDMMASDSLPKMSTLEGRVGDQARLPYILGHAVFDFIEAEYGEAHVQQFLFELRRYASDGTDDLYQATFHLTPDEFDQAFERYLKERFR